MEWGRCTTSNHRLAHQCFFPHANVSGTGRITFGLIHAEVDERRRAKEKERHNLRGWLHAFICVPMCVFMSGFISSRMRARWCMDRCRRVCADDRKQRRQRHRDHLEVRLFLGSNRRPAHVPLLLVHVARCQGSHSWPDLGVVMLRRDNNKPPATTRRSKIATITSERCRCSRLPK